MLRLIFLMLLLSLVGGPVAFGLAAFEKAPILPATATLDPRMAAQAHGLATRTRDALAGPAGPDGKVRIAATELEVNSAMATVARLARPLRAETRIDASGVRVALSGQVPGLPQPGWINFTAHVAPSQDRLDVVSVRLGRMNLPPDLTVAALRRLLDLGSADNAGSLLLKSVAGLDTVQGRAELAVRTGPQGGSSMVGSVLGALRGLAGMDDGTAAQQHYLAMRAAAADGRLPKSGSTLPWVRFALEQVVAADHDSDSAAQADLRAAFIALGAHCGDRRLTEVVAGPLEVQSSPSLCLGTTLAGRRDLRQHFTLSAALAAASGARMAFDFGETKELLDAGRSGGSGYSFDDLAFDRAGIQLFETLMATPVESWPALLARIDAEAAIVPSIDGLPAGMSEAQFMAQFGGIDTPAYRQLLAEIDARIDALPVHARR